MSEGVCMELDFFSKMILFFKTVKAVVLIEKQCNVN